MTRFIFYFKIWHVTKLSFQKDAFYAARSLQNMSFSRSKKNQNVILWMQFYFSIQHFGRFLIRNLTRRIFFQCKIWRVGKLLYQNVTCYKVLIQNMMNRKAFSPKFGSYFVFRVLIEWWFLLSFLEKLNWRGEVKDNVCYTFSRHMYN